MRVRAATIRRDLIVLEVLQEAAVRTDGEALRKRNYAKSKTVFSRIRIIRLDDIFNNNRYNISTRLRIQGVISYPNLAVLQSVPFCVPFRAKNHFVHRDLML